jgi:phosphoribosylglycinamide formyltransferase 1
MACMRVVILGSGRGSNAEAILRAQKEGRLGRARVEAIFSDKAEARILKLGEEHGVPSRFLDPGPYRTKLAGEAEQRYIDEIAALEPDLIVLAGFMRIIKPEFIQKFAGRIINLHPSLLPAFKGLNGIGQAYDYGVKYTGCTVHYVTEDVDGGPVIDQAVVRIEETDTMDRVEEKVHAAEHELLPAVIARLSQKQ